MMPEATMSLPAGVCLAVLSAMPPFVARVGLQICYLCRLTILSSRLIFRLWTAFPEAVQARQQEKELGRKHT